MKSTQKLMLLTMAFIIVGSMTVFADEELHLPFGYVATKVDANITMYGKHHFHNGLMPVINSDASAGKRWMYLDARGRLVDLGEKSSGFDFSEGLAAFIDNNGKIGYMNTMGEIAIPAQYDIFDAQGRFYSGRFINGNALVFESTGINKYGISEGEWIQIDQNGNRVAKDLEERRSGIVCSDASGYLEGVNRETIAINGEQFDIDFSENTGMVKFRDEYYIITKESVE